MNFTIGGIRIEVFNNDLAGMKVGGHLRFDLMTNLGDTLRDISGHVRNISVKELAVPEGKTVVRSYGIQFEPLSKENKKMYNEVIRGYCEAMNGIIEDLE